VGVERGVERQATTTENWPEVVRRWRGGRGCISGRGWRGGEGGEGGERGEGREGGRGVKSIERVAER